MSGYFVTDELSLTFKKIVPYRATSRSWRPIDAAKNLVLNSTNTIFYECSCTDLRRLDLSPIYVSLPGSRIYYFALISHVATIADKILTVVSRSSDLARLLVSTEFTQCIRCFCFYFCSQLRYFTIVRARKKGTAGTTGEVGNALVSAPPNRLAASKSTNARIRTWDTTSPP